MRALVSGAAIAAVAGLLMGMAAKPDLASDDRPAGPQMLSTSGGVRAAGPFADDSTTFASYAGKLPDYVLGTDATKAMNVFPTAYVPPPMKVAVRDDPPPELPLTHVAYDDTPAPAPSFPSMEGGKTAGSDLLPPAPTADAAQPAPAPVAG